MKDPFKKVAFHDFVFHADDVACAAIIQVLYGKPEKSIRISARDINTLEKATSDGFTLVDVGGGAFDHHSTDSREDTYANGVIKSALGHILDQALHDGKITIYEMEYLLSRGLYSLQAQDNGQDFTGLPSPFGFVRWLNGSNPADDNAQMLQFNIAVEMSVRIIESMLVAAKKAFPDHKDFLVACINIKNGIVDLPHYMATAVEEAQDWNDNHDTQIMFFTFPGADGNYRIQAVNKRGSFDIVCELAFKGLRNHQLNDAAGITDGIFVHPSGFIGAAESLASCRKLGIISQNWNQLKLVEPPVLDGSILIEIKT